MSIHFLYTYAAMIAKETNIKVIAALPATYSNISPSFQIASTTIVNVNFYNKHLDVKLESNYGVYDIETINKLSLII